MRAAILIAVVFLVCPIAGFAQQAKYAHGGAILLPDRKFTPGAIRADATKQQLCAKGFTTKKYRRTTEAEKKQVCREYGIKDCPHEGKLEIDHLVPLEIGGLDAVQDLWPQPAPQFHWKDKLENVLREKVCKGSLPLAEAQACIEKDWAACYRKEIGPLPSR
jgi:hypothetical protein